jgi:hypothetical protein
MDAEISPPTPYCVHQPIPAINKPAIAAVEDNRRKEEEARRFGLKPAPDVAGAGLLPNPLRRGRSQRRSHGPQPAAAWPSIVGTAAARSAPLQEVDESAALPGRALPAACPSRLNSPPSSAATAVHLKIKLQELCRAELRVRRHRCVVRLRPVSLPLLSLPSVSLPF